MEARLSAAKPMGLLKSRTIVLLESFGRGVLKTKTSVVLPLIHVSEDACLEVEPASQPDRESGEAKPRVWASWDRPIEEVKDLGWPGLTNTRGLGRSGLTNVE